MNVPEVRLAIIAVSRDCFPKQLSENRRKKVVEAYKEMGSIHECRIIVENEKDMLAALSDINRADCNALVIYLGNFGPETEETLLAKYFDGPVMLVAASEDSQDSLIEGRGDAYCGLLNASYNLDLRNIKAYIPEYPVGTPQEIAEKIKEFEAIAKVIIGLHKLKVISFGPRPKDFLACNAPIKQLYNMGIEIEENSELDLYEAFKKHKDDKRIGAVVIDMKKELQKGNLVPDILPKLAQYELTLLDWMETHKGSRDFVVFANKCWPAFQTQFGFVPCYVNGRLAARGIAVSCEVDIYGAVSEYIGTCISGDTVTILDINNTVPADMYQSKIKGVFPYDQKDTFMGFHCGNTSVDKLTSCSMKHHIIMARTLPREVTEGTLEGTIVPGNITMFRLQSTSDTNLLAYVTEGEILPIEVPSFGAIGIFAIPEMGRFYRHVLIEKKFPHHAAIAFGHHGKAIYDVFRYLGVLDIGYNQPKANKYPRENPFGGNAYEENY